jgi:hypothetical protein
LKPGENIPSEELIEKVVRIAQTKDAVNWKYRGKFNQFGLMVRRHVIKRSSKTSYRVSGKFLPMLMFVEDWRGPGKPVIIMQKYKPGDWEKKLDELYQFAEDFRREHRDDPKIFSSDLLT